MAETQERLDSVAAAFRAGAHSYASFGAPLYAALCAAGADDAAVIELAAHAQAGAQPVFHLLTAIHDLVLGDPGDPLGAYFATVNDPPLPAEEAWPAFARFCEMRREEIVEALGATTVQTTFVERCATLLPPLALVAQWVGAPLHLVEIGCSAGVLLTLDQHGYLYQGHARFGPEGAPLTLAAEIVGDAPLRIPAIASRTGLDLRPLDAGDARDRRWLMAQVFPEFREQRAQLATALDGVAAAGIRMVRGHALETLAGVLAETPDPVCIFHSVCLSYWTEAERAALDAMLCEAGRTRQIYRVGSEPARAFTAWNKGHDRRPQDRPAAAGEIVVARYEGGAMDCRIVALSDFHGPLRWLGWEDAA